MPATFPLQVADYLRANGVEVTADREQFVRRRRVKNEAEIAGIRRAQRAAEAAMDAARELLRAAERQNGSLMLDGEQLTCERIKLAVEQAFTANGAFADEFIVSHGSQTAVGHDMGSGPIAPGEPICLDLFPRDRDSGCFADMTRDVRRRRRRPRSCSSTSELCREALDRAVDAAKPGYHWDRALPDHVRLLRGARLPDAALEAAGRGARRTASSTRSATASGSRCTSSRGSAARPVSSSPATWSPSSRASTAPAAAAAGSRISCS